MSNFQKLKNIKPRITPQQSQQLFDLYQEILDMSQELKDLQKNNQFLHQQLIDKGTVSTNLENQEEVTLNKELIVAERELK
tara:strand:+ start:317 stop:559 length:243 start_codon:yes stop_codon:yes gene_type:complete